MGHRNVFVFIVIALSACCLVCGGGGAAMAQDGSLNQVFETVNPSVVKLISVESADAVRDPGGQAAVSSGVVVSENGLIMTAAHAVNVADKIAVKFLDGAVVEAAVESLSSEADIALVSLETVPENMSVAELGDSDAVGIGDQVFVIGAPYGIDHTLTVGHISGRRQSRTVCRQMSPFEFLQTDAAINQGNSGGPMFNRDGEVIGIVSRILSQSGGSVGLGFAVSINTARNLLLEQDAFWIGFNVRMLSGRLARAFNLPQDAGLLVQKVAENSPGDRMGLQAGDLEVQINGESFLIGGDIILSIQGFPVTQKVGDVCTIQDMVGGFSEETQIRIKVLRNGRIVELNNRQPEQ